LLGELVDLWKLRLDQEHEWWIPAPSDLGAILTARGLFDEAASALGRGYRLATTAGGQQAAEELKLIENRVAELERARLSSRSAPRGASAATLSP
jgi:hypothetical protein